MSFLQSVNRVMSLSTAAILGAVAALLAALGLLFLACSVSVNRAIVWVLK